MPSNFQQILQFTSQGKGTFEKTEGIKVICVGQSRTGTSSLKAALSILLPGVTYHGMDFLNEINNQETFDFWTGLREGTVDKNMIRSYFKYGQFDSNINRLGKNLGHNKIFSLSLEDCLVY